MKKIISMVLALMMCMVALNIHAEESYVASGWAKEELKKAEELKLIPEDLLKQDLTKDITRKEFAAVSVKLYECLSGKGAEGVSENPFTDTDDSYVLKAYELGITTGTGATEFSPEKLLNREQAASMLTRVYKKVTIADWSIEKDSEFTLEYEQPEKFADDDIISDWAADSVYFMAASGIIKGVGDNKFAPKNVTEEEIASGYANASREQAIIMAVRMTNLEIPKAEKTEDGDKVENVDPYAAEQEKPVEESKENTYTVAFIGGSLTEGGSSWISVTKRLLQEKMPDKEVVTINAGKGGTGSNYGAVRFMEDVGKYEPDMVFIEFSVNDCGSTEENQKMYMESMVRQCKKLAKEPVVIFLHAPHPYEKTDAKFANCQATVMYKNQVAAHYGIKTIDVYDYMQRDYEKIKDEKGYKTFTDYLKTMYGPSLDVHGGYVKYGEAIKEAIENDYEAFTTKPKNVGVYYTAKKSIVEATYNHIFVDSGKMKYTGAWNKYTKDNQFTTSDSKATISAKHYNYPFFPAGIMQVMNGEGAFGFMTKAEAFCLNYPASSAGSSVKVYVDSKEVGTLSCYSQYHAVNYISPWISLPNDGKEHKVIMIIDKPSMDKYVFRFGSVIERNTK